LLMKGVDRVRGFYLGLTGMVWGVASAVGPLLGGALTQYVSWRWNWWVNLPCLEFPFVVLYFCLRVHNPRTSLLRGIQAIDWFGTGAALGLSTMILLGLNIRGVITPWSSSKVICLLMFGFFMGIVFMLYEARFAKNPYSCHCTYFATTRIPLPFLFASVMVL
jgi:MFS family permease